MITKIHSFLVYPGKNEKDQHQLRGIAISKTDGRLYDMLKDVYDGADFECKIEIAFKTDNQHNEARNELVAYLKAKTVPNGKKIAERLQLVTTKRSGLGLIFLIAGKVSRKHKLVLARFPVEQGILADESGGKLTVQFIDRIFMKNTHSYKSALYTDASLTNGMWDGRVVDKQVNSSDIDASQYWINEFLLSDFKTTSEGGTARLATMLREAVNKAKSKDTKAALISMSTLAATMDGQYISIAGLCRQFNVPDDGVDLITRQARNSGVLSEKFRFSRSEFRKHVQYHYWETDEGVMITAEEDGWEQKVNIEKVGGRDGDRVRISTEGKLKDERLRKGR